MAQEAKKARKRFKAKCNRVLRTAAINEDDE